MKTKPAISSKHRVDRIVEHLLEDNHGDATATYADAIMIIFTLYNNTKDEMKPTMKAWVTEALKETLK